MHQSHQRLRALRESFLVTEYLPPGKPTCADCVIALRPEPMVAFKCRQPNVKEIPERLIFKRTPGRI